MYLARDLMSSPAITVAPDATLEEAAELLLKNEISGLAVVDLAGQLVGMFSELDEGKQLSELLAILCGSSIKDEYGLNIGHISGFDETRQLVSDHGDYHVKDVMTTVVIVVNEDDPATRVIDLFTSHGVHRLPVLRGNDVVGIIGVRDVVRFIRDLKTKLNRPELSSDTSPQAAR
ncbi:MAG: CBS domain-containing protein [Planctomycetota bacterium]|nr:CBS domain-containing protein [Planctomycetota bacterium]